MRDFKEEDFFPEDRKKHKKVRKIQSATDRSKYKKTDQKKLKRSLIDSKDLKRGRVIAITGEVTLVLIDSIPVPCSLKGALKKERTRERNLIAVGDFVQVQLNDSGQGAIAHVEGRFSYLSRIVGRQKQLIAVNIDQAFVTVSVVKPPLKPSLVDRYMIAAEKGKIQPIILINKIDLLEKGSQEDKNLYDEFLESYGHIGTPILSVSAESGEGIDEIKEMLKDKSSVFSGQSGVGKSSILNTALGLDLKVGELIEKALKGRHTTTKAEFIPLDKGGFCVDTPGIRSFGIYELKKREVIEHFHEITAVGAGCKFPDCIHLNEPSCAVIGAFEKGKISRLRFESYRSLMNEIT